MNKELTLFDNMTIVLLVVFSMIGAATITNLLFNNIIVGLIVWFLVFAHLTHKKIIS